MFAVSHYPVFSLGTVLLHPLYRNKDNMLVIICFTGRWADTHKRSLLCLRLHSFLSKIQ